jgi:PPOX class probable F420-dependent enzyme
VPVPVEIPQGLLDLLGKPSPCFLATLMPDGSPQLTQTWVTTDGEHILINTVSTHQKARNVARDPRVAVNVADPADISRYYAVRGRVVGATTDGAAESIDDIAGKYLGGPYPRFGGASEQRLLLTIEVDRIAHQPWE